MTAAGLPDELRGADYVKTFNNDKLRKDYQLTIQLASAADLYVFTDDRVMAPDWVRANFELTEWKIGMEREQLMPRDPSTLPIQGTQDISYVFSVWRLSVPAAGTVKLGRLPTYPTGQTLGLGLNWTAASMYGIAAVARSTAGPGTASQQWSSEGHAQANRVGTAPAGTTAAPNAAAQASILQSRSLDSIIKELGTVPRPEHPRPDQYRSDWHNLNGVWEFAFDPEGKGQPKRWQDKPDLNQRKIVVPFAPESVLSGVHDEGFHPHCWYARSFDLPEALRHPQGDHDHDHNRDHEYMVPGMVPARRLLLHFGAVDYRAEVWLNGQRLGDHEGGYDPFDFDVTSLVKPSGNRLVVRVEDDPAEKKPRGKQSPDLHPGASVYSPRDGHLANRLAGSRRRDLRPRLDDPRRSRYRRSHNGRARGRASGGPARGGERGPQR